MLREVFVRGAAVAVDRLVEHRRVEDLAEEADVELALAPAAHQPLALFVTGQKGWRGGLGPEHRVGEEIEEGAFLLLLLDLAIDVGVGAAGWAEITEAL